MRTIGAVAAAAALSVLCACSASATAGHPRPVCGAECQHKLAAAMTPTVVYELTSPDGANAADITFTTASGGTSQQQGVAVPLVNRNHTTGIRQPMPLGSFAYFSAQNTGGGTLTCTILAGHRIIDQETSSGQYAIVTCQGTV